MTLLAKRLTDSIKRRSEPLFVFAEQVLPAASLYMTVRVWEDAFRRAGLKAGDRIVVRAVPGAAYLAILLASLRQGYVFCPLRETAAPEEAELYGARLVLMLDDRQIDNAGLPLSDSVLLPVSEKFAPTPGLAMILATSGSSGKPRLVALSADNILAVLESHLPRLDLTEKRLLSVLPWHHAFGLILELLGGILGEAAMFVRSPQGGRDVVAALQLGEEFSCNALFAVPLFLERLLAFDRSSEFICGLQTGVVGGAPVSKWLSKKLTGTQLCIGYGQTEASPGITLGRRGFFAPGYIGEAVGCEIRLKKNRLQFRGRNAAVGIFSKGGMESLPKNGWRDTGDLFAVNTFGLRYLGRQDGIIKLPNGRKFNAALAEAILRERFPEIDDVLFWSDRDAHPVVLLADGGKEKLDFFRLQQTLTEIIPASVRLCFCLPESFQRDAKGGLLRWQTWQAFEQNLSGCA